MGNVRFKLLLLFSVLALVYSSTAFVSEAANNVQKPNEGSGRQTGSGTQTSNARQIIITKLVRDGKTEIKNVSLSELILDEQGCTYEPADKKAVFTIKKDVFITADNIAFSNFTVNGDLYICADNAALEKISVNGTVYIDPLLSKALKLNNVTFRNVSIITKPELFFNRAVCESKKPDSGKSSAKAYLEQVSIDDKNSLTVIVNKTRSLPSDWKPGDLTMLNLSYKGRSEARYLRREASEALTRMFAAARKDGIDLCAVSGYRSYELQKKVFADHVSNMGLKAAESVSARPGYSEHQTGLAVDISSKGMNFTLSESFGETREGIWLDRHAAEYGFILRYPKGKEHITGYAYEPWHFRYVGREMAVDIMNKGLTLEEYFGLVD